MSDHQVALTISIRCIQIIFSSAEKNNFFLIILITEEKWTFTSLALDISVTVEE